MSATTLDLGAALAGALGPVVREAVRAELADFSPAEPPTALLTGDEAARELRCSERQVRRLRALGMPCVRLCDSYRYCLSDCIAWLKAQEAAR